MAQRIVMIEDEPDLLELVGYGFRKDGFDFQGFTSGRDGMAYLRRYQTDLLLLDIMLPGENGLELCRSIRQDDRLGALPIVFVTAKGAEFDRILGLELGADDYVVKPFSPRELSARVKAVLRRRARQADPSEVIETAGLRLDAHTQDVIVRGQAVTLSALEFRLLYFLASHPRRVFSRERLLDEVWGGDHYVTPRTVDVHIRRIREKVEAQPENPEYIGTVRGAGYRFVGDAAPAELRAS
jgi:two-component system phosphate regulon response regulator PhoB